MVILTPKLLWFNFDKFISHSVQDWFYLEQLAIGVMVRAVLNKVQELFRLRVTIPRHNISNCSKLQLLVPIIKYQGSFIMPINMLMPIKVFISSLLLFTFSPVFWTLYKLVFSTTKSIKKSGKKDKNTAYVSSLFQESC